MVKLVILNQGLTGQVFELTAERTTVGRVEDNNFQITDPSVSSRHAEILLRGAEVVIRDLNSTNGSFINGEKISETVLQPGQILRLGQVELKIDDGKPVSAPSPVAVAPPPPPAGKLDGPTMVIPRGVSLEQLEQGGGRLPETNTAFSKKTNKSSRIFLLISIVVGLIIVGLIIYLGLQVSGHK